MLTRNRPNGHSDLSGRGAGAHDGLGLVGADEFAACMARVGPFEPAPHIAVAVSGGADSLTLVLLLHDWAAGMGGRITGLTVDHGLRPEAAAEAAVVERRLRALGIEHRTLRWRGRPATGGLQAAARAARYDLLMAWCRDNACLHLVTAHHLDDQAETVLLRLAHGSGLDGLAAMAPVVERTDVRILRPLLGLERARLTATLQARGETWIEDPSNRDPAFARARLRALMPALAAEGLGADQLAACARRLGQARASLEGAVTDVLARVVAVDPAGYAMLDPDPLKAAPRPVALRALARVLVTVGGRAYAPRAARLERLLDRLQAGLDRGMTLAGCRIVRRRGRCLVARENRGMDCRALEPGRPVLWDGRFAVMLSAARVGRLAAGVTVGPLGSEGQMALRAAGRGALLRRVPAPARASLPALRTGGHLMMVPPLRFAEGGDGNRRLDVSVVMCRFQPRIGLTDGGFTVA